jgi:hypothetical protein
MERERWRVNYALALQKLDAAMCLPTCVAEAWLAASYDDAFSSRLIAYLAEKRFRARREPHGCRTSKARCYVFEL